MIDAKKLVEVAWEARRQAYAPYSEYTVGAAVLDEQGRVFTGCNVENVSYPASICAERTAIVKMVSEGGRTVRAIALATVDGGTPCGICLQVLLEFAGSGASPSVYTSSQPDIWSSFTLGDLLPHGFKSQTVKAGKSVSHACIEPETC